MNKYILIAICLIFAGCTCRPAEEPASGQKGIAIESSAAFSLKIPDGLHYADRTTRNNNLLILITEWGTSEWYLVSKAEVRKIQKHPSTFQSLYEIEISPDGKYLATVTAEEGHPILAVSSLPAVLAGEGDIALRVLDPYPGYISITGWEGDFIRIESDMPLIHLKDNHDKTQEELILSSPKEFMLDIKSGRIKNVYEYTE